jgi:hypothetical protein
MSVHEIDALLNALDTIGRLDGEMTGFHEEHKLAREAAVVRVQLQMVRWYLTNYAKGLSEGLSPQDAMLAMLAGERKLTPEQLQIWDDHRRLSMN